MSFPLRRRRLLPWALVALAIAACATPAAAQVEALSERAAMEQARKLEDAGKLEAALELYEQLASGEEPRISVLVLQATALLRLGRVDDSLGVFDRALELDPEVGPYLWQRGVALHLAERYDECARQFGEHGSVRPGDSETAVWHFACRARSEGVESARSNLMPAFGDRRVVMESVYRLAAGRGSSDLVLEAAERGPTPIRSEHRFYAHFYLGLIELSQGNDAAAAEHFDSAARADFDDILGDVAQLYATAVGPDSKPPVEQ